MQRLKIANVNPVKTGIHKTYLNGFPLSWE